MKRKKRTFYELIHLNDAPKKIALGAALGVFLGIFPTPFYTAPLIAALLAHFFKLNRAAAFSGAFIMNPLFAPFFWSSSAIFGTFLLGGNPDEILETIRNIGYGNISHLKPVGLFLLSAYLLGNIIISIICAAIVYLVVLKASEKYQKIKSKRLKERKSKE